jgi:hypothetical protein
MERIRFITHQGKQILVIDLAHCRPAEVEKTLRTAPDYVTAQPLRSVLLLADFTEASFNEEALRVMKETATFDKPYIKKTAWIGTQSLPDSFQKDVSDFSKREFPVFRTQTEALEWLTKD